MNATRTTLLITLTGRDRPGVTSRLFGALTGHELSVLDIEQVVIRGRLVLGVLCASAGPPDLTAIHRKVSALAADLGLDAEITAGSPDAPRRRGRLHVSLLGSPLSPEAINAIAGRIAASGANIDRITPLAQDPVTCVELDVSGADPATLRSELAREAAQRRVDVAVQRGGLQRRAMRLIVMDVDSTLIQDEVIDLLADRAGCAAEVAKVTEATMRGDLDFEASLRERVALLAGLNQDVLDGVRDALRLRERWLHPDHRPARGRARHRLRGGQRAADRGREAHRPGGRAGHRPRGQGGGAAPVRRARRGAAQPDGRGRRRRPRA